MTLIGLLCDNRPTPKYIRPFRSLDLQYLKIDEFLNEQQIDFNDQEFNN